MNYHYTMPFMFRSYRVVLNAIILFYRNFAPTEQCPFSCSANIFLSYFTALYFADVAVINLHVTLPIVLGLPFTAAEMVPFIFPFLSLPTFISLQLYSPFS